MSSNSSIPLESHRLCLIPPSTSDNLYDMLSTKEAHQRLSAQGFLLEVGYIDTLYLVCAKTLDSKKEKRYLA